MEVKDEKGEIAEYHLYRQCFFAESGDGLVPSSADWTNPGENCHIPKDFTGKLSGGAGVLYGSVYARNILWRQNPFWDAADRDADDKNHIPDK